jgi:hypothetical protein
MRSNDQAPESVTCKPDGYCGVAPYIMTDGPQGVFNCPYGTLIHAEAGIDGQESNPGPGGLLNPSGNTWWISTYVGGR